MEPATFVSSLTSSIAHWKLQLFTSIYHNFIGKKGVWIRLPIERVNLVEAAVKEGFWYHHAEPDYLMLVYWIPQSPHTLPTNSTHRVGIGAFLINQNRECFFLSLSFNLLSKGTFFIFIVVEVLTFRQSHKSFFEKSDLFFLCMLRPLSFDIQKQEQEIEAAKYELLKYMHDICKAKIDGKYSGFSPLPSGSYSLQKSYLYVNSSKAPKRESKL
ncbi:unnamed protein product [Malus baccata var. baccata]